MKRLNCATVILVATAIASFVGKVSKTGFFDGW